MTTSFIQSIPTSKNPFLRISLGTSVSFLILVVLILLIIHCIKNKNREDKDASARLENQLNKYSPSVGLTITKFTAPELWIATGGFRDEDVIAKEGDRGKVYKGILEDKSVVAIKKFKSDASSRKRFFKEASILSQINHRHVVRLLGYCTDWKEEALVYEYINNGTLYKHIHENSGASSSTLSFHVRMKIAVQIAAALGYLHSSTSKPSIIHQNVDSKRILLEEDYTARLASFSGAKLITKGPISRIKSTILQKSSKFSSIQSKLFIHKKVDDVYRFGLLLVELLTSKSQEEFSHKRPGEDKDLRYMKRDCLGEILDPRIINEGNVETAKKVAVIAESCLSSRKDDRPSMEKVAIDLMANLSPSPAMANFSPSPEETDLLLGSSPKMANISPSLQ